MLALYSASFGRVSGIYSSPNRNLRIVTEVARSSAAQPDLEFREPVHDATLQHIHRVENRPSGGVGRLGTQPLNIVL